MELPILTIEGKLSGKKANLPENIFNFPSNEHAVYLDIKNILANKRQGTHKAKEKGEVTASTRKVRKQKGTGAARRGSLKSPILRGGGRVFGPRPRDYGVKLNKKLKNIARKSILSDKANNKNILLLEPFSFEEPKTKNYLKILLSLKVLDKKTLLVLDSYNSKILLSGRNISNVSITTCDNINSYDLINADKLIIISTSLDKITKQFD